MARRGAPQAHRGSWSAVRAKPSVRRQGAQGRRWFQHDSQQPEQPMARGPSLLLATEAHALGPMYLDPR